MRQVFWTVAGAMWFMGHMQCNLRGHSRLSTDETWELSRHWAKGKTDAV